MVRTGTKMSMLCLNKIRPRVRVRAPAIQSKGDVSSGRIDREVEVSGGKCGGGNEDCGGATKKGVAVTVGRKIMIVVDSSMEAKNALQWALTHCVQKQDVVTLLYVPKPSKHAIAREESGKAKVRKVPDFLCSMKNLCELKKPEVKTEIFIVEGEEKGPIIIEEAKKQEVALLVLGQKKRSMKWRMLMTWAGNRVGRGVVEHCIQNATCMAVAVRKKSKKHGGYLITTKKQKDFWLLA